MTASDLLDRRTTEDFTATLRYIHLDAGSSHRGSYQIRIYPRSSTGYAVFSYRQVSYYSKDETCAREGFDALRRGPQAFKDYWFSPQMRRRIPGARY